MKFNINKNGSIEEVYNSIRDYHSAYLVSEGVKLPALKNRKGNYTKDALVLTYLARGYPLCKEISKQKLTNYVRQFYPTTTDVQQARHLGRQKGWFIISGTRGDLQDIKKGHYMLISLKSPYPGFVPKARITIPGEAVWFHLKERYDNSCATCGSKEGKPNRNNKSVRTSLDKGHMDPNKPLDSDNTIPQCQICNRADKDNWVYDDRGRVVRIANPNIIKRSSKEVRWEIYKILSKEFHNARV